MSATKSKQSLSNRYSTQGGNSKGEKSNKGYLPLFIMMFALVCVFGIIITVVVISSNDKKRSETEYNKVYTPNNIDELKANNKETVAKGTYDVRMNGTWKFPNARSASSNAYVENVLANSNAVYFTLVKDADGEELYKSPVIPVGSSLGNIKLSQEKLGKGTYPCTVIYHLLDDKEKEISTVRISVDVVIEGN